MPASPARSITDLFDLTGKSAVVTGASSGLGVVFAETLAAAGARVMLAARRVALLEAVAENLRRAGSEAEVMACDVSDAGQVEAMVAQAWERFGRVDIQVNNAGVVAEAGMMPERVPPEVFLETIRVDLLGVWHGCRAAGARMLADGRGGSIINVSSVAGLGGAPDFAVAYQTAKAGVINLTRNLACSWGDRGVRVNTLAPGWFPSEMTQAALSAPSFAEWVRRGTALGRLGEPRELAAPLLFLASEASSFVTGATLVVDGGVSASIGGVRMPEDFLAMLAEYVPAGRGRRIVPGGE